MDISIRKKITLQLKLFLSYWSVKDLGIQLFKTKLAMSDHNQPETINLLVPKMSIPSIMSRYMFNIACFLKIEV